MNKIIDYQIVSPQDSYGNISTYHIDILMKEGWQPLGGVCAYNSSLGHNHLYQAMVKYDTDTIEVSKKEYEEFKEKAWKYDELE